ncbi:MAG: hypothetical protein EZS28_029946 [Streblomastix strix]|uniref:UBC core domain-containing protein n=1 Tax=Streblomastix strix TaxID=222440 RepID=A0A5J4UW51_9EUKA|nr:MAG: hypothetical protein EZS28_029946 [Streblomastix strix]
MSKAAFIRLQKDYAHLLAKPLPGVEVKQGTPYEGGKFHIIVRIPEDYPFKLNDGSHISTYKFYENSWKPSNRIRDQINLVLQLLEQPEPQEALNPEIGIEYIENRAEYDRKAREWTKLYAK